MILFTHNDLDALGCMLCIDTHTKMNKTFYTDYRNFDQCIKDIKEYQYQNNEQVLVIADVCFSEKQNEMLTLTSLFKRVMLIDHHSYKKETITLFMSIPNLIFKLDQTRSATLQCYDIFNCKDINNVYLKALTHLIDVYDMWRDEHKDFNSSQNLNKYFWKMYYEKGIEYIFNTVKANNYRLNDNARTIIKELLDIENKKIQEAKDKNRIQRHEYITFIFNSNDIFNPLMIKEMQEGQKVVVGIYNNVIKVRVKKGAFTDDMVETMRQNITHSTACHLYAFTYLHNFENELDLKLECCRIIREIKFAQDEIPF